MNCTYLPDATGAASVDADAIAIALTAAEWSGAERPAMLGELDSATGGRIREVASQEKFEAAAKSQLVVQTTGLGRVRRVILVGLGDRRPDVADALGWVRDVAGRAAKEANGLKSGALALWLGLPAGADAARALRFAYEGAALALYRFDRYRKEADRKPSSLQSVAVGFFSEGAAVDADAARRAQRQAVATTGAIRLARDLVNEGPNALYPEKLAEHAAQVAKDEGLEVTVYDLAGIREMGFELLPAVSAGSDKEPRLVHLVYRPEGADASTPSVAIVGKGLTFDSGGYNLKPTGAIDDMKIDMAGAAAVIGAMKAIKAFAPAVTVHAVIPSSENLISGSGYKLGDVYRGHNGKTVEIRNTDAEGRLILIDGIGYALRQGVSEVTTLATLTGACVVALGPYAAGLFARSRDRLDGLVAAAERAGEDAWPLPMCKKLEGMLESDVADLKNVGERWGGSITAALFLEAFADDSDFAHIDLAGPSYVEKPVEAHIPKGGTGYGVLTLLEYLTARGR